MYAFMCEVCVLDVQLVGGQFSRANPIPYASGDFVDLAPTSDCEGRKRRDFGWMACFTGVCRDRTPW